MLGKLLRWLIGVLLLPVGLSFLWSAGRLLGRLAESADPSAPFVAGLASAALLRLFLDPRSSWAGRVFQGVYVFGHELTHAAAAWLHGAHVGGFKAGADGGHVDISRSNAVIALAPYCVPVYAAAVALVYRAWSWARPSPGGAEAFLYLMGLAVAFHLLFTAESLWRVRQPDLKAGGGTLFSLAVIAAANGLGLLLILKALFPGSVPLGPALAEAVAGGWAFWRWTAAAGRRAVEGAAGR